FWNMMNKESAGTTPKRSNIICGAYMGVYQWTFSFPNISHCLPSKSKNDDTLARRLKNTIFEPPTTGIAPPSNVLRHSFGTYSLHDDEDKNVTSFKMGSAAKT